MFLFSPENFGSRHISMDLKINICKTVSLPSSNVVLITCKVNGLPVNIEKKLGTRK